jgi:phosphotransferase family enzyme
VTWNRLHPLELLHPNGKVTRCLVLGSNCLTQLAPNPKWERNSGPADLVLLTPSRGECRSKGWLDRAVLQISKELSPDGLLYAIVPPLWRSQFVKMLRLRGLVIELSVLHLPNLAASHYLVPLRNKPTRYVIERLLGTTPARRQLALFGLRFGYMRHIIKNLSPSIALVASRERVLPLFNWLRGLEGGRLEIPRHVVVRSPRPESRHVVLHCFYGNEVYPTAIAKVRCSSSGSTNDELKTLQTLGGAARQAGADVPVAMGHVQIDEKEVSIQTTLKGTPAARLLDYRPLRMFRVLAVITKWLEAWNRATAASRMLDEGIINGSILKPAKELSPFLDHGQAYLSWLIELCRQLKGSPVPLVVAHNDLTMSNVLLLDSERFGVIDWETAGEEQLPMMDFYYMVADAAAATQHYQDRELAFEKCFLSGNYVTEVAKLGSGLEKSMGISKNLSLLCFHACWLHHAANEQSQSEVSQRRPFLGILQKVAKNRETF